MNDYIKRTVNTFSIFSIFGPILYFLVTIIYFKLPLSEEKPKDQKVQTTMKIIQWYDKEKILNLTNPTHSFSQDIPFIKNRTLISKNFSLDEIYPSIPYGNIGLDAKIPTEKEIRESVSNQIAELVIMKDVFITHEGVFIYNNTLYPLDCDCHFSFCKESLKLNYPSRYRYIEVDNLIAITHEYGYFFAHWMMDFMPSFFLYHQKFYIIPKF